MKTCTFFGHRDCPDSMEDRLYQTVETLIVTQDVNCFLVGDKGNFDRIVHRVLHHLQNQYIISCTVVLSSLSSWPPRGFEKNTLFPWGIEAVPPRFSILYRNQYMLNCADMVVAYVSHPFGGAAQFIEKAIKQNKPVINLAP